MPKKKQSDAKTRSSRGQVELPTTQRILVPIDFSDSSVNALRYAAGLALKVHANLTILYVVPVDYGWLEIGKEAWREYDERLQSQAAENLRALANDQLPKSASVDLEVRIGRPAEQIVAAAAESKADLILLSTHGHTGLDRVLIGSVADRVARLAPCPVFLMRPGKSSPERKKISPNVLRFKHKAKPG
jgi:nucleotide-binding universal stress UspA family protein